MGVRSRRVPKQIADIVALTDIDPVRVEAAAAAASSVANTARQRRPRRVYTEEELEDRARTKNDARNSKGQFVPGSNGNPNGKLGNSGTGGVSFRHYFQTFWNRLTEGEREYMWQALFQKAAHGDIPAIKLLLEYNKEIGPTAQTIEVDSDTGCRITLTVPQRDDT